MIELELNIRINGGMPDQEEKLRMELRRTIMQYVFDQADTALQGSGLTHRNIGLTGDIFLKDD